MKADVLVLGAGIVGVSIALHLQARGRKVALIDRKPPGRETSYGNAGLIERSSVIPYPFPRDLSLLLPYAFNRRTEVRYHLRQLPRVARWLAHYWRDSSPRRVAAVAAQMLPLIERSVLEHDALADASGAHRYFRRTGWIECMRDEKSFQRAIADAENLAPYGLRHRVLDAEALHKEEPSLGRVLAGAIHWQDPVTVSDPGAVTQAYANLYRDRGGEFLFGDAATLSQDGSAWSVRTDGGAIHAPDAVIALGPWSCGLLRPLGYRIPLAVKRGYHRHFSLSDGAVLEHPVVDVEHGYVLSPMVQGVRLTTGVEFAHRDASPTPVQLERATAMARQLLPLGPPVESDPWMGSRPCLPDMRPVIGPAARHAGLWMAFGHCHHGFTLGPVTGRLMADLMTGTDPGFDANPFLPARFD